MQKYILFLFILIGQLLSSEISLCQGFPETEILTFKIRWGLIPAGEATLEVHPSTTINDTPASHFVLTARTYPVVDLFYKLRQRIDSYVTPDLNQSLLYKETQDGKSKKNIVVTFDWQKNETQYSNYGQMKKPVALPPGTIDPLSAVFFLRKHDLSGTEPIKKMVTDGNRIVMGNAQILGREKITCYGKTYETYKLQPDMRDVRGVFQKSKNAKMFIWITSDERKMLVKLKSKVVVGSFVAELFDEGQKK